MPPLRHAHPADRAASPQQLLVPRMPGVTGPGVTAFRAVVTGLVQGVGYRYWAARQAQRLGVAGWVRNLPGGEVEVLAQADAGTLDVFAALLAEGPRHARVAGVQREAWQVDPALAGFRISG